MKKLSAILILFCVGIGLATAPHSGHAVHFHIPPLLLIIGGLGVWADVAVAAVGIGTSLYGSMSQSSANEDAIKANEASNAAAQQANWQNYLLQRGISAPGVATGAMPTSGTVENSRLPLWAQATVSNGPQKWQKAGAAAPNNNWALNTGASTSSMGPGTPAAAPSVGGGSNSAMTGSLE